MTLRQITLNAFRFNCSLNGKIILAFLVLVIFFSSTVSPSQAAEACTISTSGTINRRSGAGINFDVVGQLTSAQNMTAIGQETAADGFTWWQLSDGSFVRADLVSIAGDCSSLVSVPVSTASSTPQSVVPVDENNWEPINAANVGHITDTFFVHSTSGTLSSDNQWLATYNDRLKSIELWATTDHKKGQTLPTESPVVAMEFSTDSQWIAVVDENGITTVWSVTTGDLKSTWTVIGKTPESRWLGSLVWSPDSKLIVFSYENDRERTVWDVNTGMLKATLNSERDLSHSSSGDVFRWSPNSRFLLIRLEPLNGDSKDTSPIELWDMNTGTLKQRYNRVAFSPNGQLVATKDSPDASLQVWDAQTDETKVTLESATSVSDAVFSSDSTMIAIEYGNESWQVWDIQNNKMQTMADIGATDWFYYVLAFTPHQLILTDYTKKVVILDPVTGELSTDIEYADVFGTGNLQVILSSDDGVAALTVDPFPIRLFDINTGKLKSTIPRSDYARFLRFSSDGSLIALNNQTNNTIELWDVKTGKLRNALDMVDSFINFAFTSDGQLLTSAAPRQTYTGSSPMTEYRLQIWSIPGKGVKISRAGVILTTNRDAPDFEIPDTWLPNDGLPAQYEIRIKSVPVLMNECVYVPASGSGYSLDTKFVRIDIAVAIINRDSGKNANQKTYPGVVDKPICPYDYPGDTYVIVSELNIDGLQKWVLDSMSKLGYT
jgi:WD40 repeat protein